MVLWAWSMNALSSRVARLGPLTCRIVETRTRAEGMGDARPDLVALLCHGYGAPGTDLVGLAGELCALAPALEGRVAFVFPEAPLALEHVPFGGRAWWHIDVERFQRATRTGQLDALTRDVPEGLGPARRALRATVDAVATALQTPISRIVVGGFSQGAMLTTDLALRLEEAPAALALLSGTVIARDEWQRLAPQRRGLRVLQSHGVDDPLLPHEVALSLRALLADAGLDVEFVEFRGGHGIAEDVLVRLAALLESLLSPQRP